MTTPQEVLDNAELGDTVKITLRGPASVTEIDELRTTYENYYPDIKFEFETDGLVSNAEIVGHNG